MELSFITPSVEVEYPLFRRRFHMPEVREAQLSITGLGLFCAYINGMRVGSDYLTPGFNDYDAYLRVYSYDVTNLLKSENTLEVYMGKGWCMSRLGPCSGDPYHWGREWVLGVQLKAVDDSGEQIMIETNEDFEVCRSPITMNELYDGEHRDDTVEPGMPVPCRKIDRQFHLIAPMSPPIREVGQLKPVILHTPNGEALLDFGQNFAGVVRFVNRLPRGETILIETGEVLQDGCLYRDNLLTAKSEFRYTSDGVLKEVEPYFAFFGFRYARITGLQEIDPADFTGVVLSSNLADLLTCSTNHPLLNRLIENSLWSQRSNFLDVPTDCPQRDERLGWLGDIQVYAETACFQRDCKAFFRKFMQDMRGEQVRYYDGNLPMYVPSLKGEAGPGGAVWADAAVVIPWQVYMAYGDLKLLAENYPMMVDYTEYLIREDRRLGFDHIRFDAFTFGDWLALDGVTSKSVFGGTDPAFIQAVYYLQAVRLTGAAAGKLGYSDEAANYKILAEEILSSIKYEYLTAGGRLAVDTQTAYVLALRHGIYHSKEKLLMGFQDRLRRDGYSLRCGFTGGPLIVETLLDSGLIDEAYRILLSESFPGWLYEVRLGATTIWERWNSLNDDGTVSDTGMDSFNHYAYGSVCNAIYSRIMGLRCTAPGFSKVEIAPKVNGRIRHCNIRYASAAGVYSVEWKIDSGNRFTLQATVPKGAEAFVILPGHPEGKVDVITGETRTYRYVSAIDWLHPFNERALILDLLSVPEACKLMQEWAPTLWKLANDPQSDVRAKRLNELSWGVARQARAEAVQFIPKLKSVEWPDLEEKSE